MKLYQLLIVLTSKARSVFELLRKANTITIINAVVEVIDTYYVLRCGRKEVISHWFPLLLVAKVSRMGSS